MTFALHERLGADSFFIEDWELCRLQLRNNKVYPWLYLVPRRENIREIYDLKDSDQAQLMREISLAAEVLNAVYNPAKINTAILGNMVPQLHAHVFARYRNDPAWPRPVWAVQAEEIPYTDGEKAAEIQKLKSGFDAGRKGSGTSCRQ